MIYLFIVLGVLLLIGVTVLLMPLGVKIYYNNKVDAVSLKIKYFGLTFTVYPQKKPKKKKKTKKKKKKQAPKKSTGTPQKKQESAIDLKKLYEKYGFTGLIKMVDSFIKSVWHILVGILNLTTVKKFLLNISVTGKDAADTAIICGWAYSVICPTASMILNAAKKYKESSINIAPDYTEGASPRIEADVYLSILPISVMLLLIRNSKPYIKLIKALLEAINSDSNKK